MPNSFAAKHTSLHRELGELLRARSLRIGEFKLASGATANAYMDVKKTGLSGRGADLLGRALWALAQQASPAANAVGGLTLGADPLVTAIALAAWQQDQRDLSAVIVRKEAKGHGTRQYLERPDLLAQPEEIIAVDDVITTGGSTLEAIARMRDEGFQVAHAICVVDRESGGAKNLAAVGVTLHSLFTLSELLESRE